MSYVLVGFIFIELFMFYFNLFQNDSFAVPNISQNGIYCLNISFYVISIRNYLSKNK